jgi:pimeloyl-ACP methyl ester carboxylesterase/predicted glycosyltransferase
MTRAREPDARGHTEVGGVRIGFEVFGEGEPTVLLLPTWTIIHSRFWKAQVPYLARHFRVVTFDGPGNGRSDRPLDPSAYTVEHQAAQALAVLDATGTERAVLVGLSQAARSTLRLTAYRPERVLGAVFIGPAVALEPLDPARIAAFERFEEEPDGAAEGWAKYNRHYWLEHLEDFAEFFFAQCFPEPHSTKQIEDCVGWALETTPEVLIADVRAPPPPRDELLEWCAAVERPVLVLHGDADRIVPLACGAALAELTGGTLATIEGGGHIPLARDPVRVNLLIREFVESLVPPRPARQSWRRALARPRRALYVSSPIGLGHALRDCAIAGELRRLVPDLQIDWLAVHPVTEVLAARGERIHPMSRHLASESAHIESEAGEHDLPIFQAIRRMDEILLANLMVFHDVVRHEPYDLWIGDEAWDLDHHLHENPELKTAPYVWLTDFVGWLPTAESDEREAAVVADYNAEMIEQIERHPSVRDRAIFVGEPDDIVPDAFGPGLPAIREWTQRHYDFAGYIAGFPPLPARDELRARHGYRDDETVCIATAGGSGVCAGLLRRAAAAYPLAREAVPGLRMVAVCGPRIDPAALPAVDGVEVRPYVHHLYEHLAACDLALTHGGLTTTMELVAHGRPFLSVPLRRHFEQQRHVAHRLDRHGATLRLDYDQTQPETLAAAVAAHVGSTPAYRPVEPGAAARAAALIAELL